MANTVIALKKSATPSATPPSLANGEIAINYADGVLFYKHANGSIASITAGGNSFGTVDANGTLVVADTTGDIISLEPGTNIAIVGDAINDKVTISLQNDVVIPSTGTFKVAAVGGDEGGEIKLGNAITNSVLTGDIVIDVYQNRLRFYESGGTNRGAFINLASTSTGVGTDLLAAASTTDSIAREWATAAFARANTANITADRAWNHANAAFANANTVMVSAQSAFTVANAAFLHANAVYAYANSVSITANLAFAHANNAYAKANAALPNTDGVSFGGSLTIAGNLSIRDAITSADYVQLDTAVTLPAATSNGRISWNDVDGTIDVSVDYISGTVLQVGQEQLVRVKNQSGETIYNGNAVMHLGTVGASGLLLARRAVANGYFDSRIVLGMATQDIPDGGDGFVTSFGKVRGLNTTAFNEGDLIYVDPANPGSLVNTAPTAPNNKTILGTVVVKHANVGEYFIRPVYGSSLLDDEHGEFTNITNDDIIQWKTANNRFENTTANTFLYGVNVQANTARDHANAAFARANLAHAHANAAFAVANTSGIEAEAAFLIANISYAHANAAFATANAALPKAGGTITGDLIVQGNATISGLTTYANTQTLLIGDNIIVLNADLPLAAAPSENAGVTVNRGSSANVDLIWNEGTDKWTFNEGTGFKNIASNTDIEGVTATAVAAFGAANTAGIEAEAAFLTANISYAHANAAFTTANAAIASASAGQAIANAAFSRANLAHVHANAAFAKANAALPNTAGVSFAGALTIPGILFVTINGAPSLTATGEIAEFAHNANSYTQIHVRNANTGQGASGDLVVTADTGTDVLDFIDIGINGSGYSQPTWTINGPRDGYLYTSHGNLAIGVANVARSLAFFTGGTLAVNERMRITETGNVGIGTTLPSNTLHVIGTANISGTMKSAGLYDSSNRLLLIKDSTGTVVWGN